MVKLRNFFLHYTFIFLLAAGCNRSAREQVIPGLGEKDLNRTESLRTDKSGLSNARVTIVTDKGTIVFRLYTKAAPVTTTRFMQLVQQGFYNGQSFHRVIPNFIIQTGDPTGLGKDGGSGVKLKPEFSEIQHIQGTVAMARAVDQNSTDSQFYISLSNLPHLDGKYTVIGQVVDGLEVLSKIAIGDKMNNVTLQVE